MHYYFQRTLNIQIIIKKHRKKNYGIKTLIPQQLPVSGDRRKKLYIYKKKIV